MSLPPLNQLRAFEAAARHLSFTAAAAELNMTQSAVSQQIKSLESHLRQPLFYRRPRALELTVMGMNYVPVVREAFQTLSRGTRMLMDGGTSNALHVEANVTFTTQWLGPRLPRLYARHPDMHLHITTSIWDQMERAEDPDIEFRFLMSQDADPAAERLTWDRFYPVCAPDYRVTLAEIENHRLFYTTAMMATWDIWAEGMELGTPKITHCQVLETGLAATQAGAGLCMAHDSAVSHLLAQGRLIKPFAHEADMPEAYYLKVNPKADSNPQAKAFSAWVRDEIDIYRGLEGTQA